MTADRWDVPGLTAAEDAGEPLEPGDPGHVGAYPLLRRLGVSVRGRTYLAAGDDGPVVLRLLDPGWIAAAGGMKTLTRTVETARRLTAGPGIVPVLDVQFEDGELAVITEYVPGPSLRAVISGAGALPAQAVTVLAGTTAAALAAVHEAHLVYGDLHPGVVVLGPSGSRIVGATFLPPAAPRGTHTGNHTGDHTAADDVRAWAATMAYASTGRAAFLGLTARELSETGDPGGVLQADALEKVPAPFARLVWSCLDSGPGTRPTAQEVVAHLGQLAAVDQPDTQPQGVAVLRGTSGPGSAAEAAPAEMAPAADPDGADDPDVTDAADIAAAAEVAAAAHLADEADVPVGAVAGAGPVRPDGPTMELPVLHVRDVPSGHLTLSFSGVALPPEQPGDDTGDDIGDDMGDDIGDDTADDAGHARPVLPVPAARAWDPGPRAPIGGLDGGLDERIGGRIGVAAHLGADGEGGVPAGGVPVAGPARDPNRRRRALIGAVAGVAVGGLLGATALYVAVASSDAPLLTHQQVNGPGLGRIGTDTGTPDTAVQAVAGDGQDPAAAPSPLPSSSGNAQGAAADGTGTAGNAADALGREQAPVRRGTCSARFELVQTWPGGFKAEITVMAAGGPVKAWQVSWSPAPGQAVRQSWNATLGIAGGAWVARNVGYNGMIKSGAATTFGFVGNGPGQRPAGTVACRTLA